MKRIYLIIRSLILSSVLFGVDIPINYTIVPGVNLFSGKHTTYLSTGTISSEVYRLKGIQFGPVYSIAFNDMDGIQVSGVFNISPNDSQGLQAAGVFNLTDKMDGFQAGGVFNIADDVVGFQAGGVFNIASDMVGFQAGGVFNISDDMDGFQAAGVINVADNIDGLQVAGVVNVADDVEGSQIGVINVAGSGSNVQVGIINIVTKNSRHTTPIGLINLYRGGTFDISTWMDTKGIIYQSLDTGSQNVYTQFYTGATEEKFQQIDERIFGTAIGFKLNPRPLTLDVTLGAKYIHDSEAFNNNINNNKNDNLDNDDNRYWQKWTPEVKATLGLRIGSISIFGGVYGDFQIDDYNDGSAFFADSKGYALRENVDFHYNWFAGAKLHF